MTNYCTLPHQCPICGSSPIVAYDTTNHKFTVVCPTDTAHNKQEPCVEEFDAVMAWDRGAAESTAANVYKNGWNTARKEVEKVLLKYLLSGKKYMSDYGTDGYHYDYWHFNNLKRLAEELGFDFEEELAEE